MSDTTTSTETSQESAPENTAEKTPEFYESELKKVREEAARHRTSKREAVEAAKAEVANEWQTKFDAQAAEFEAFKAESAKSALDLVKLRAALPDEQRDAVTKFASLLQGSTEEEITAHAEDVRSLFGAAPTRTRAVDPSPAGKPPALNDDDALLAALKGAVGIN